MNNKAHRYVALGFFVVFALGLGFYSVSSFFNTTPSTQVGAVANGLHSQTSGEHAHPDDPAKASEHTALLDLVLPEDATHTAIANGNWSDPNVWSGGQVPGHDARVIIPEGKSVTYGLSSHTTLKTVGVYGTLGFATNKNTKMKVDTLVVAPGAFFEMGTAASPVQSGKTAEIVFANNGPLDLAWDTQQLSRGFISHGTTHIHGERKTSFVAVDGGAEAGDTTIALKQTPLNWRIGDTVIIPGTQVLHWDWDNNVRQTVWKGTLDEERVIRGINGRTITIDPLTYDHPIARPDLEFHVANMTRNVRFETENGDSIPVRERGHVMFMHSDQLDVRYAGFYDLGRTNKNLPTEPLTNPQGRYAMHLHRTGTGSGKDPSQVIGNALVGSPGWGYVNHESYAIFEDNASYDVSG